jgi:nitrite reductase/ring-hydroxylating ferredoxin subunit
MNRRKFIEQSCFACAATLAGVSVISLESCASSKNVLLATYEDGSLVIPLDAFKEQNTQVVKANNYSDEVFVVKENNAYKAFKMKCTHKGAGLKVDGNELKCPLHGSRFDITEGKVLNGPAKTNLQSFLVTVAGDVIKVKVA